MPTSKLPASNDRLTKRVIKRLLRLRQVGVLCVEVGGKVLDANNSLCMLLGFSRLELKGRPLSDFSLSSEPATAELAVGRLHQSGHLRSGDLLLKRKDGSALHFQYRLLGRIDDHGDVVECRLRDGTVRPPSTFVAPEHATRLLAHDEFIRTAEQLIEAVRQSKTPLTLLSICVDRIDDASVSSDVPQQVKYDLGSLCAGLVRSDDVLSLSNESCVVALLPGCYQIGGLRAAERLRTAIATMRLPSPGRRFDHMTVSIGVATTRTGRLGYKALWSRADTKRDDAHSVGGNRVSA